MNASAREHQIVRNIYAIFRTHRRLRCHAASLHVSVQRDGIVVQGNLPSRVLRDQLLPAIRQAGVMWQVVNRVQVT